MDKASRKETPGPRAQARAAKARAAELEGTVDLLYERLGLALRERDEARKTVEELAGKLGFEVEWEA